MRHLPNLIKVATLVAEIWRFNCFQYGGRPWLRDAFCIAVPNCEKIGQTIMEKSRFCDFRDGDPQ